MGAALINAEKIRQSRISVTNDAVRQKYSQYLTPVETAKLAVDMFSNINKPKCLDLGAGTGILSVGLVERFGNNIEIDLIEKDKQLCEVCDNEISNLVTAYNTICEDAIRYTNNKEYDIAILNPPYKKMSAKDIRQSLLPISSPNLYSAFVVKAISMLKTNGECVAIIPRSWMNGQYFTDFRKWISKNASIDWIHIYESRSEIFKDTNVLQEIILVKFSKKSQNNKVTISQSSTKSSAINKKEYLYSELINIEDSSIQIKPKNLYLKKLNSLKDNNLCASTGKIVDFRCKEILEHDYKKGFAPLIYPKNFTHNKFIHPIKFSKPQWVNVDNTININKLLLPPGSYVIVKRFSSKEEKKRIHAYYYKAETKFALENHLNYIHAGSPRTTIPLSDTVAKGLTWWLNSYIIDEYFRSISGSTQVNATDLNNLQVPNFEQLKHMSKYLNKVVDENIVWKEINELY